MLVERVAPLVPPARQLWGDLPVEDRALWARLSDPAQRARLLDDPDFACCEGHIVAVGTVP
jgi:hypothetical protein